MKAEHFRHWSEPDLRAFIHGAGVFARHDLDLDDLRRIAAGLAIAELIRRYPDRVEVRLIPTALESAEIDVSGFKGFGDNGSTEFH